MSVTLFLAKNFKKYQRGGSDACICDLITPVGHPVTSARVPGRLDSNLGQHGGDVLSYADESEKRSH